MVSIELDVQHPCNCIVDYLYEPYIKNLDYQLSSRSIPDCLKNLTRSSCDLNLSQCKSTTDDKTKSIWNLSFIGLLSGGALFLVICISLATTLIYRRRNHIERRMTDLFMDQP
ncbi:unnamed protein product, partial [Didymodactylos carnosus]